MPHTVVLHVEGTLVDSNYHHSVAWARALSGAGVHASLWRVHRSLGLEPARMVAALAGDQLAAEHAASLQAEHDRLMQQMLPDVVAQDGAEELLTDLAVVGFTLALTASCPPPLLAEYVSRLVTAPDAPSGARRLHQVPVAPSLDGAQRLQTVMDGLGVADVVVLADSTWACVAARRLGQPAIAVRTGAFTVEELLAAGAEQVFESLRDLHAEIEDTVLARPLPSSDGRR